jgi:hypothetical protein
LYTPPNKKFPNISGGYLQSSRPHRANILLVMTYKAA